MAETSQIISNWIVKNIKKYPCVSLQQRTHFVHYAAFVVVKAVKENEDKIKECIQKASCDHCKPIEYSEQKPELFEVSFSLLSK